MGTLTWRGNTLVLLKSSSNTGTGASLPTHLQQYLAFVQGVKDTNGKPHQLALSPCPFIIHVTQSVCPRPRRIHFATSSAAPSSLSAACCCMSVTACASVAPCFSTGYAPVFWCTLSCLSVQTLVECCHGLGVARRRTACPHAATPPATGRRPRTTSPTLALIP